MRPPARASHRARRETSPGWKENGEQTSSTPQKTTLGTRMCQRRQRLSPSAANVARLRRDRLLANRGRMPGFATSKTTKPGSKPGFVIDATKKMSARQLSGRNARLRSARARGHAGGHAGAGQDIGGGNEEVHGQHVNTNAFCDAT